MENKEIKGTRPETHDCNECKSCQNITLRNWVNYCAACQFIFFEKLYHNFSNYNSSMCNGRINYYEWIPWERLSNIKEIGRGGFGIIYEATQIDGLINPYSIRVMTSDYVHKATTTEEKKGIFGLDSYIPPEVIRGEKFTTAGDIYSFAMLLWELSTGRPPLRDRPHDNTLILNIVSKGIKPEIISPLIPPSIAKIIVKCWDVNPENRPTAEEVKDKL
ncbi:hypothetical protein G9A89_001891 [Geosiphon pyriformis]|nr:hypothetical protein G9A89_001891 [Geosiphon pyriformis]